MTNTPETTALIVAVILAYAGLWWWRLDCAPDVAQAQAAIACPSRHDNTQPDTRYELTGESDSAPPRRTRPLTQWLFLRRRRPGQRGKQT